MLINLAELNNDEFITEIVDEFNFQTRGENVRGKKSVVIFNGSPPVQGFNYNVNYNENKYSRNNFLNRSLKKFHLKIGGEDINNINKNYKYIIINKKLVTFECF